MEFLNPYDTFDRLFYIDFLGCWEFRNLDALGMKGILF